MFMPWNKRDYPESMKNLDGRVRGKAVEIANALLEDGYEEGRAIAIATAKAKEWNEDHPKHEPDGSGNENGKRSASSRSNLHVVPYEDGWAIKEEGNSEPRFTTETKEEAVKKAQQMASDANISAIVHHKDGTVQTSHNYS
ncbi:MAG: hypothetical protein K0R28_2871 [Paenibacillus sp.]|jgi:uncharacterized protein YdaT|nr:hypothetical protein [Paenibacillus sp.]